MNPKSKKTVQDTLTLEYDLFSLPTAQHKAGLVGLLLMIESMKRREMSPLPEIVSITDSKAEIRFSKESMQLMFDDLFDAEWIVVTSKTKWKNATPIRIEENENEFDGKKRKEKVYCYKIFQPKLSIYSILFPTGSESWIKLWRDSLWGTLRGIPATRNVFEDRANGNPFSVAGQLWTRLLPGLESIREKPHITENIASSQFIGAQDVNAERVPYKGLLHENFLLYFWTIPSLIYVPQLFTIKGEHQNAGYVFVIPEPLNLVSFSQDIQDFFQNLNTKTVGFRPQSSLIDIPQEGGLEYLCQLTSQRVEQQELQFSVASVEIHHLEKQGNNIRIHTSERIVPSTWLIHDYENLKKECRNPIYKSQRIRNLLDGNPWQNGFNSIFQKYPWEFFIYSKNKTPKVINFFGQDVEKKFRNIKMEGGSFNMDAEIKDDQLAVKIYGLIKQYVNRTTEEKSGQKYEDFKNQKNAKGKINYPEKYLETREKICSNAFLAMRGRRDKDFIEYFTGTICSVPQWMPEADYVLVGQALIENWELVKTYSMLALSACSFVGKSTQNDDSKGDEQ